MTPGGTITHLAPWDPDTGTLEPTEFRFAP